MAKSINKVILIGNLGNDPEMRFTNSGKAVANLSLATSDSWTDKNTGEKKERTEWHRVVAFDKLAEIMGEYLKKGSKVYIEGRLQTKEWEKDGVKRYTTEILANDMAMLDSKGDNQGGGTGNYTQKQKQSAPNTQQQNQSAPPPQGGDFEDDIPF